MAIPLLYTLDNNYAMQAAVSLTSLFENNKTIEFELYVISDHISDENKKRLITLAESYHNLATVIEMPDLDKTAGFDLSVNGWAKAAYCRLFLTSLLPKDIDRILYIDPDTIIVNKIDDLVKIMCSQEFDDYFGAACVDFSLTVKRYHGFKKNELYFNTGVLVINLKKWRERNAQNVFVEEIKRRNGQSVEVEQSYINCVLINKIMKLPAEYNVVPPYYKPYEEYRNGFAEGELYTQQEISYAIDHPVIVHFARCEFIRPWFSNSDHPMKGEWEKYLKMTEWKNYNLQEYICKNDKESTLKGKALNVLIKSPVITKLVIKKTHGFIPKQYRDYN